MRYAALIPCGPAEIELARVADLVEALAFHDPEDCALIFVLEDGNPAVHELAQASRCRVVPHPRAGRGWGWGGGLIGGQLWAWETILREHPEIEAIVKFDTDALPIRPLGAGLEAVFADPSIGMAGSRIGLEPRPGYKTSAPLAYFANKVQKLRAPVSLWRKPRWHLRFAFGGAHRRLARMYAVAESRGYVAGELIEGGTFAVHAPYVRALVASGVTGRWAEFLDVPTSDDVVLTMLTYYAGFRAVEAPLFSVEPATLRFAPADLLADETVGIVHSLKAFGDLDEAELRAQFRAARR